jgi:hypothetical protein
MALGKQDTDTLYDRCIAPQLRRRRISPIRIDRVEHNDDIDDRIIQELKSCDLALADLTYARPSVYFEAGFAARQVPVIYTCRKDHFKPQVDDPFGNFRVHFDLQMKNIIPWSSPNDPGFVSRLNRRIDRVIRPLLRERQTQEALAKAAAAFHALPLRDRLNQLLLTAQRLLRKAGYKGMRVTGELLRSRYPGPPSPNWEDYWGKFIYRQFIHYHFKGLLALRPGWLGQKAHRGVLRGTSVHVASRVTQSAFDNLAQNLIWNTPYDFAIGLRQGRVHAALEHLLLISLNRLPVQRIMSWLPDFRFEASTGEFVYEDTCLLPTLLFKEYRELYLREDPRGDPIFLGCNPATRGRNGSIEELRVEDVQLHRIPRHVHLRVIDNIGSRRTFATTFAATVKETESENV